MIKFIFKSTSARPRISSARSAAADLLAPLVGPRPVRCEPVEARTCRCCTAVDARKPAATG